MNNQTENTESYSEAEKYRFTVNPNQVREAVAHRDASSSPVYAVGFAVMLILFVFAVFMVGVVTLAYNLYLIFEGNATAINYVFAGIGGLIAWWSTPAGLK